MWSFKEEDPPNGAEGTFIAHDYKGSRSVNLLGGLLNPPSEPPGTQSFTFAVNQVCIVCCHDYDHTIPYDNYSYRSQYPSCFTIVLLPCQTAMPLDEGVQWPQNETMFII